jgi:hypothetical protein
MKNLIYVCAALAFVVACGPANKESNEEEHAEAPKETQKYNYSGSFEIGDRANFDIIRQWNDGILAGDTEKLASLLADSVTINLWDGAIYNTTNDSIMTLVSGYLESVTNYEIIYNAGMAVNSLKQMDNWGLSWTTEQYTDSEGKPQRIHLQENWLIENGKVRSIRQYAQLIPESVPPIVANNNEEFSYSGSWEKADDALKEVVLGWNNALASPTDFDAAAEFLADSVTVFMWDGTLVDGTKDSVMNVVKKFVAGSTNIKVEFDAMMAVHSTDRNSDVVMSWTDERITDLEGKEERIWIHEDYVLENGKIRLVYQYGMKEAEAKE